MSDPYVRLTEPPEDANNWRTVRTIIYVCGIGSAIFMAGISYGQSSVNAQTLKEHITASDRMFVRKDGRELEAMQGQIKLMDQKIDLLLENRGIKVH